MRQKFFKNKKNTKKFNFLGSLGFQIKAILICNFFNISEQTHNFESCQFAILKINESNWRLYRQ